MSGAMDEEVPGPDRVCQLCRVRAQYAKGKCYRCYQREYQRLYRVSGAQARAGG